MKSNVDDLQQYVRRQNLRIFGVPVKKKETNTDIENMVKETITDHGISEYSLHRAHRIGKIKKLAIESETVEVQPIIARFTTFRDRTAQYRVRQTTKESSGYGISLDLSYDRLVLLKEAHEKVKNVDGINFAYSDINCQLRVLTKNEKHLAFNTVDDLLAIIASM